jgi:hypothetical protein
MALSPYALVSLSELRPYAGLEGGGQDDALEAAIGRATAWLESHASRHFVTRGSRTEYHTVHDGSTEIVLSQLPTIAVTSIHESTALPPVYDATSLLVADTDYQLDREHGRVRRLSSGCPTPWGAGTRAIRVVHSYGYRDVAGLPAEAEPVPDDIKLLALFTATAIFKESDRARWGVSSVTDAMGSVTRYLGYLPPDMKDVLLSYRRREYHRTWELA